MTNANTFTINNPPSPAPLLSLRLKCALAKQNNSVIDDMLLATPGRVSARGLIEIVKLHRDASQAAGVQDSSMRALRSKIKGKVGEEGAGGMALSGLGDRSGPYFSRLRRGSISVCVREQSGVPLPGVGGLL